MLNAVKTPTVNFPALMTLLYVRYTQFKKVRQHIVIMEIIVPTFIYQRVEIAVISRAT
jgi:hypothetical protein